MFKNIFFFVLQIFFIAWIAIIYFSDENINNINKSRSKNYSNLYIKTSKIPSLDNDTIDIIEYVHDSINDNDEKKYNEFFKLLDNNEKQKSYNFWNQRYKIKF